MKSWWHQVKAGQAIAHQEYPDYSLPRSSYMKARDTKELTEKIKRAHLEHHAIATHLERFDRLMDADLQRPGFGAELSI